MSAEEAKALALGNDLGVFLDKRAPAVGRPVDLGSAVASCNKYVESYDHSVGQAGWAGPKLARA
ncbi:hypothetical protein FRC05_007663 [Tulasnella sp. 425]|nr:hypothetical protein FRC05_007663 [Tulasnella sp. 425]